MTLTDSTTFTVLADPPKLSPGDPWILDVCLDYFSVCNPWLVGLPCPSLLSSTPQPSIERWLSDPSSRPPQLASALDDPGVAAEVRRALPYLNLPHRPDAPACAYQGFIDFLFGIPHPPLLITIARSVEDGFISREDGERALREVRRAVEGRGWGGGPVVIEEE